MNAKYLLIGVGVLFIAGVLTASGFAELDPETCVGVWLFDEGEGGIAADSSGKGNNGELMGDPEWVDGKFGSALEFGGSSEYVDCGDDKSLSITKTITVQAWVQFEGSPSSAIIISKYGVSGSGLSYMLVINGDGGAPGRASFYLSGWKHFRTQINDSDWHHLAATVSSEGIDLYVDGELDSHYGGVASISVSNSTVTIGAPNSNHWGAPFKGVIDDAAIFDVALEQEDILALMDKGLKESLYPSAVDVSGKLTTTWANIKAR